VKQIRLVVVALAPLLLTGFLEIHDEAIIKGSGAAVVRRTVKSPAVDELENLLENLRKNDGEKEAKTSRELNAEFKKKLCDGITGMKDGWERCRWEGNTLIVERSYSRKESPFSSSENGYTTFALHHFLSNKITYPPFPLVGIGPVMQSDDAHRSMIRDLQDKGYKLDLTIRMPGKIRMLWGKNVKDGGTTVFINLLDEWPEERAETFIMSEAGLLYSQTFQMIVIIALVTAGIAWMRWAKR
jgi:hypothetical protein